LFGDCALFQSEVEETLKRIQSHKGVQGLIVVNSEGIVYVTLNTAILLCYYQNFSVPEHKLGCCHIWFHLKI